MNILIVESRYFPAVADALLDRATLALEKGGARFERFSLPGVLELPAAIAAAARSGRTFEGYVALGCVLGLAATPDTLYRETVRGLVTLGTQGMAIGNGWKLSGSILSRPCPHADEAPRAATVDPVAIMKRRRVRDGTLIMGIVAFAFTVTAYL